MQAKELIKGKIYRTTQEKQSHTCYLRFSHFDEDRRPNLERISGVCYFPKNGRYLVLPLDYELYEISETETTF